MKALLFEGVPPVHDFDGAAAASISGTGVYWQEVVKALFRHGTYDAYYFLWRTPFIQIPEERASALERLDPRARVITVCDLERLNVCEDVVLFTPAPYIHGLIPLRSTPQSARWIASGVMHSLDGWDLPHFLLSLTHSDVDDADSLLCSTHSARAVLEKLFAATFGRGRAFEPSRPSLPVIPLGIDCRAYLRGGRDEARRGLGIPDDDTLIVYVGRLSPISKCDLLPLCHVIARTARADIRLVIAGDDTQHRMAAFLESAAAALGCGNRVTVRPDITDAEKINILTAADIFVAPSDHTQETFGLSVAEAMAAALPVLASDWDGYRELIEHDTSGFLIPTYWLPLGEALDRTASTSFMLRNSTLAVSTVIDLEALEYYLRLLIERPELRKTNGRGGPPPRAGAVRVGRRHRGLRDPVGRRLPEVSRPARGEE
jgi:glycosyltransferase involved in cell wall biosynthesis